MDNYLNSKSPPLPGTVYFYEVRPVIDNVLARSVERNIDGVIRIFFPPRKLLLCSSMDGQSIHMQNDARTR